MIVLSIYLMDLLERYVAILTLFQGSSLGIIALKWRSLGTPMLVPGPLGLFRSSQWAAGRSPEAKGILEPSIFNILKYKYVQ